MTKIEIGVMLIVIIVGCLITAAIFILGMWMITEYDKQLQQSAITYENCVIREYGMTPIKWYEEQGMYPSCQN